MTTQRISFSVFFLKWVFPFVYLGVVFFIAGGVPTKEDMMSGHFSEITFSWVPVIMCIGGFFALKVFIWPIMDEVLDSGVGLIFRRGNKEVRVSYSDISRIARSKKRHNYSIIVYLKNETVLGSRLVFYPKVKIKYGVFGDINDTFDALNKKIRAHNSL